MTARYARQVVLPEIGEQGQALLGKARVLVVGAGGLGAPALLYLTAAGVGLTSHGGCIGIVDDDVVDSSNLQRQIIFREADQGLLKSAVAAVQLQKLNSETNIVVHPVRLDAANILDVLQGYDVMIDGSDNFATKYLLNDAAIKLGKPVVYGSILGFEGHVSVFWADHGPCYRCIYPAPAQSHIPNCAEAGTLGGIAGVIGSIQAVEACKLALGVAHCKQYGLEPLVGKLLVFDALTWDMRKLALSKSDVCPACSADPASLALFEDEPPACGGPVSKPITLRDFQDILEAGIPMTLIDVREESEWHSGHIDGAIHIPLDRLLSDEATHRRIDPENLVVIYCQQGIRSAHAVSYLRAKGFEALNFLVDWPR